MSTQPSSLYLGSAAVVNGPSWSFSGANITGISAASVASAPVPKTQLDAAVAALQANIDANHRDDIYTQSEIDTINSTLTGYATSFTTAKLNCPLLDLSGNSIQNGLSGSSNLRITSNAGDITLVVPTGKGVSLNTLKARDGTTIAIVSDLNLGNAYRAKQLLPAVDASDAVILSQLTAEKTRATAAESAINSILTGYASSFSTDVITSTSGNGIQLNGGQVVFGNGFQAGDAIVYNFTSNIASCGRLTAHSDQTAIEVQTSLNMSNNSITHILDAVNPQDVPAFHQIADAVAVETAVLQAEIDTLKSQVASLTAWAISVNTAQYHRPDLTPVNP